MFNDLCALIADQFGVEASSVTADTSFIDDLGADSVDLIDLSMALEDDFGLPEIQEDELTEIVTVGDLYKYIQEHLHLDG